MTCDFFEITPSTRWENNLFFSGPPDQFSFSGMDEDHFTATASYDISLSGNEKLSIDSENTFWVCWVGKDEDAGDEADFLTDQLNVTVKDISFSTVASTYESSFGTPSVTTIEPNSGQPFTVPVIMTSDSVLSGAQLDLSCNPEVAKIVDVTLAEGLSPNTGHNIAKDGGSATISFFGNEKSAKDGLTVATVMMQPVAEGTSALSITSGTVTVSGTTPEYQVTVPDAPVTVEVKSQDKLNTSTYVSAVEDGITLLTYTPGKTLAEGRVPAYNSKPMFKDADGNYLFLVKGTADASLIGQTDGTAVEIAHPKQGDTEGLNADLNDTDGRVNIVDAQIAYDIANGKYTEIADALTATTVDMLHWLRADVNGDGKVEATDARAIQAFIHTHEWFKEAA